METSNRRNSEQDCSIRRHSPFENLDVRAFDGRCGLHMFVVEPRLHGTKERCPRLASAHAQESGTPFLAVPEDVIGHEEHLWLWSWKLFISAGKTVSLREPGKHTI